MRLSLRTRLLLTTLLPAALLLAGMAVLAHQLSARALERSLGKRLASVAQSAAAGLRPADVTFLEAGDEESRTHRRLTTTLQAVRDATGVRRLVLFDPEGLALCDTDGRYPIGTPIPDLSRDSLEVERALGGKATASKVLFTGSDGLPYKSGYAPVRDGERVVGAVLVDGTAAFYADLDRLRNAFGAIGLVGLAVMALLAVLVTRLIAMPIRDLAAAAERIGEGDLATPVDPPRRVDELGSLGRSLEQMRASLEARERELQMMLAGIAHEVRNPLGGIELFSGLLDEELEPGDHRKAHVARIRKELGHLAKLVEEFLDYAREREPELADLVLGEMFFELSQIEGPSAQEREVVLQLDAAEDAVVRVDASLLRRAVLNLLRNAIQASPEGGVVRLRAHREGARVLLAVEDAGAGVPEEKRERIFEPFFTTKEKGSGLGLALVAKTAKVHGGEVRVEEAEGGGARFVMALPAATRGA
ncbi:MAG: HAMP domain-containing sensor histidine kinase [Deltaproteobacteria bacterium]|nr:HAMP domain-containing sensor histidine kinase [Deltaproteobacteria bacterium]